MTDVRFIIGRDSITLYMDGKNYSIGNDYKEFNYIKELLETYGGNIEEYPDVKEALLDKLDMKANLLNLFDSRNIPIEIENGLLKYKGYTIRTSLVDRIIEVNERNGDLTPFVKFIENLFLNPSEQSINELYMFLERNNLPITENGNFLAYKKVALDFMDLYSGKMDNSPGNEVWMHREEVNPDRNQTCSRGLHVCSKGYLSYYGSDDSSTVIVVEVNPRDVVSVPSDYDDAKMRVCRYKVLKELPEYRYHKVSDYFANTEDDEYIEIETEKGDVDQDRLCGYCGRILDDDEFDVCYECQEDDVYFDTEDGNELDSYPLVRYCHAGRQYEGYGISTIPANMSLKKIALDAIEFYVEVKNIEDSVGIQKKFKASADKKPYERKLILVTNINNKELDRPRFVAPESNQVEII